jgi:hypothetical protein
MMCSHNSNYVLFCAMADKERVCVFLFIFFRREEGLLLIECHCSSRAIGGGSPISLSLPLPITSVSHRPPHLHRLPVHEQWRRRVSSRSVPPVARGQTLPDRGHLNGGVTGG